MTEKTHRTHWVKVQILCDDRQTAQQAKDRVHGWLETFGETAPSHGFEFYDTEKVDIK